MNKLTKRIVVAVILLLIIGGLAWPKVKPLFSSPAESNQQNNSQAESMLEVEAIVAGYETIQDRIFTTGTVQANESVELSPETSGIITDIFFQEGRQVYSGDLLLKINDSELQAQQRRAQFRLTLAEQREERQKRLLERGGISQEDYDATLNEVNILRSEIQLIDAQIEKTEIRAPFNGIIGLKSVSTGAYITPQNQIATLQEINPVKIDFSVPERYITRVNVGDEIKFNVQGTDSTFTGKVYAIEPRIDEQTRTLQIRARSPNESGILFPGAFADIELILNSIDDALMLPTISVIPELNGQKVFKIENGMVSESRIQTGIRLSEKVQVTSGIARGDTVLTTGLLQVRPGQNVDLTIIQELTQL